MSKLEDTAEPVEAFAVAVEELASILEKPRRLSPLGLLQLVSHLYGRAVDLPEPAPDDVDFDRSCDDRYGVSDTQWRAIYESAQQLIGDRQYYWQQFDPYAASPDGPPEEPVVGDLADDLADIYRDVVPPLRAWRTQLPELRDLALWEWRFHLQHHWGHHATNAMAALHAWSFGPS